LQKRYLPIFTLTITLFITAAIGYLFSPTPDTPPVRILLDNKGGKVIFAHQSHATIEGNNCRACHHTSGNEQTPPQCSTCHVAKFNAAFTTNHQKEIDKQFCTSCHHPAGSADKFSHEKHVEDYAEQDCQSCHHDAEIEPEPQACSDCHDKQATGPTPSLRDATHARCADCHDDMYQEGLKGCRNCHSRQQPQGQALAPTACSTCHTLPANELIPTKTNAFHGQCIGCHEQQEAGPFGDDACYKCHMK